MSFITKNPKRDSDIFILRAKGLGYAEIGRLYNLSRARIRQIYYWEGRRRGSWKNHKDFMDKMKLRKENRELIKSSLTS